MMYFIDEDEFTDVYSEYAERSRTDWFWIVDRDFILMVNHMFQHEREFIHVFKISQLEEKVSQ